MYGPPDQYFNMKYFTDDEWDNLVKSVYDKPYKYYYQNRDMYDSTEFNVPMNIHYHFSMNDDCIEAEKSWKNWLNLPVETYSDQEWEQNHFPDLYFLVHDLLERGILRQGRHYIKIIR